MLAGPITELSQVTTYIFCPGAVCPSFFVIELIGTMPLSDTHMFKE